MRSRLPEIIVVTRDAAVAHAVTLAAAADWTEWHRTFGSALRAIRSNTEVFIIDAALDATVARLIASIFVTDRPDARAILLQLEGAVPLASVDPRVTVLPTPWSIETLAAAISMDPSSAPQRVSEQVVGAQRGSGARSRRFVASVRRGTGASRG